MSDNQHTIVALEVWHQVNVPGQVAAVIATRLPSGAHMVYQTTNEQRAGQFLAALVGDNPSYDPGSDHRGFSAAQSTMMPAAAFRMAARMMHGTIGGKEGWQRVYGGPFRLQSLNEEASSFLDAEPSGDASAVPQTAPVDDNPTFDDNSFAARRRAKRQARERKAAREAAAAGLAAAGKVVIRAIRDDKKHPIRLAHIPVIGLDADGVEITTGVVRTSYPGSYDIEASDNPQLDQNVVFWYYRPTPGVSIAIGVSAAHGGAES